MENIFNWQWVITTSLKVTGKYYSNIFKKQYLSKWGNIKTCFKNRIYYYFILLEKELAIASERWKMSHWFCTPVSAKDIRLWHDTEHQYLIQSCAWDL